MATFQGEKRANLLRSAVIDGSIIVGGGLVTYGAWLIYEPAGFVVPGLLLLGLGLTGARR